MNMELIISFKRILELLMFVSGFVITEVVNLFITRSEL